ncbi:GIY-YIG nuclease family protein [Motiliproteus sp. SC1-56]|uniref:GIY-YIG nuclease family protein n=1 Tax=Motiliproteus sp. SC1-56 TaxID=2799565 RepID=UPI001A8D6DD1|nr:GIY-YIG nuclease family protein [Motiliproteus sp. SC1-56]
MTQGRSIRLFLVDGSPSGLLTAEIMNWTGHALTGPRTRLSELVKRPECARTGVYFLVGTDPDNTARPLVYIGESDDVAKRLKQHNQPEEKGGKDFWERVCLITSKDQNLTKAHVKYLESRLMALASASGRCGLKNGTAHDYSMLPEADQADMAFFVEQIRTILPVLGFDFLRDARAPLQPSSTDSAQATSPLFELKFPKYDITARAQESDGEFVVLAGSQARDKWIGSPRGYHDLFEQLIEDGVLKAGENGHRVFAKDHAFSSPSAAAAVVVGRPANGRTKWLTQETGQTYGNWQAQQVESDTPEIAG